MECRRLEMGAEMVQVHFLSEGNQVASRSQFWVKLFTVLMVMFAAERVHGHGSRLDRALVNSAQERERVQDRVQERASAARREDPFVKRSESGRERLEIDVGDQVGSSAVERPEPSGEDAFKFRQRPDEENLSMNLDQELQSQDASVKRERRSASVKKSQKPKVSARQRSKR